MATTIQASDSHTAVATVAALDTAFQAAVKANDVPTMDRILADDFVLVVGDGRTFTKSDILAEAWDMQAYYERQDESNQTVRVWGNTAVVTATLWIKGVRNGTPMDYHLWYSDTYVNDDGEWHYVFGQASLPFWGS